MSATEESLENSKIGGKEVKTDICGEDDVAAVTDALAALSAVQKGDQTGQINSSLEIESKNDAPPSIDLALVEAIRIPRDKVFIEQQEKDMQEKIQDENVKDWELPLMNTYQRLLVHRIADHFGLSHSIDPSTKQVTLAKRDGTRIPSISISLLASNQRLSEAATSGQSTPSNAHAFRIMRRAEGSSASRSDSPQNGYATPDEARKDRRNMTIEEREAAYKEARQRIFGSSEDNSEGITQEADLSSNNGEGQSSEDNRNGQVTVDGSRTNGSYNGVPMDGNGQPLPMFQPQYSYPTPPRNDFMYPPQYFSPTYPGWYSVPVDMNGYPMGSFVSPMVNAPMQQYGYIDQSASSRAPSSRSTSISTDSADLTRYAATPDQYPYHVSNQYNPYEGTSSSSASSSGVRLSPQANISTTALQAPPFVPTMGGYYTPNGQYFPVMPSNQVSQPPPQTFAPQYRPAYSNHPGGNYANASRPVEWQRRSTANTTAATTRGGRTNQGTERGLYDPSNRSVSISPEENNVNNTMQQRYSLGKSSSAAGMLEHTIAHPEHRTNGTPQVGEAAMGSRNGFTQTNATVVSPTSRSHPSLPARPDWAIAARQANATTNMTTTTTKAMTPKLSSIANDNSNEEQDQTSTTTTTNNYNNNNNQNLDASSNS